MCMSGGTWAGGHGNKCLLMAGGLHHIMHWSQQPLES